MGRCTNCQKDITTNFDLHIVHCQKRLQLCQKCNEPYPREEIEEHWKNDHQKIFCAAGCGSTFEKLDEHDHMSRCQFRQEKCRFCTMEDTVSNLRTHEDSCGSRTEKCPDCQKYVLIREFEEHQSFHMKWMQAVKKEDEQKDLKRVNLAASALPREGDRRPNPIQPAVQGLALKPTSVGHNAANGATNSCQSEWPSFKQPMAQGSSSKSDVNSTDTKVVNPNFSSAAALEYLRSRVESSASSSSIGSVSTDRARTSRDQLIHSPSLVKLNPTTGDPSSVATPTAAALEYIRSSVGSSASGSSTGSSSADWPRPTLDQPISTPSLVQRTTTICHSSSAAAPTSTPPPSRCRPEATVSSTPSSVKTNRPLLHSPQPIRAHDDRSPEKIRSGAAVCRQKQQVYNPPSLPTEPVNAKTTENDLFGGKPHILSELPRQPYVAPSLKSSRPPPNSKDSSACKLTAIRPADSGKCTSVPQLDGSSVDRYKDGVSPSRDLASNSAKLSSNSAIAAGQNCGNEPHLKKAIVSVSRSTMNGKNIIPETQRAKLTENRIEPKGLNDKPQNTEKRLQEIRCPDCKENVSPNVFQNHLELHRQFDTFKKEVNDTLKKSNLPNAITVTAMAKSHHGPEIANRKADSTMPHRDEFENHSTKPQPFHKETSTSSGNTSGDASAISREKGGVKTSDTTPVFEKKLASQRPEEKKELAQRGWDLDDGGAGSSSPLYSRDQKRQAFKGGPTDGGSVTKESLEFLSILGIEVDASMTQIDVDSVIAHEIAEQEIIELRLQNGNRGQYNRYSSGRPRPQFDLSDLYGHPSAAFTPHGGGHSSRFRGTAETTVSSKLSLTTVSSQSDGSSYNEDTLLRESENSAVAGQKRTSYGENLSGADAAKNVPEKSVKLDGLNQQIIGSEKVDVDFDAVGAPFGPDHVWGYSGAIDSDDDNLSDPTDGDIAPSKGVSVVQDYPKPIQPIPIESVTKTLNTPPKAKKTKSVFGTPPSSGDESLFETNPRKKEKPPEPKAQTSSINCRAPVRALGAQSLPPRQECMPKSQIPDVALKRNPKRTSPFLAQRGPTNVLRQPRGPGKSKGFDRQSRSEADQNKGGKHESLSPDHFPQHKLDKNTSKPQPNFKADRFPQHQDKGEQQVSRSPDDYAEDRSDKFASKPSSGTETKKEKKNVSVGSGRVSPKVSLGGSDDADVLCDKCVKMVPRGNYTLHAVKCPGPATPKVKKNLMPRRERSPTPPFTPHRNKWLEDNKPVECKYCKTDVPSNNIFSHHGRCEANPSRGRSGFSHSSQSGENGTVRDPVFPEDSIDLIPCEFCPERISVADVLLHQRFCVANPRQRFLPRSIPIADDSPQAGRRNGSFSEHPLNFGIPQVSPGVEEEDVPCEYCMDMIPFSKIRAHESFCRSRLTHFSKDDSRWRNEMPNSNDDESIPKELRDILNRAADLGMSSSVLGNGPAKPSANGFYNPHSNGQAPRIYFGTEKQDSQTPGRHSDNAAVPEFFDDYDERPIRPPRKKN